MTAAIAAAATTVSAAERITIFDYCDPDDPAWNAIGGCLLREGDVTLAEFNQLLTSVLSTAVVGHPGWRFEPSFAEAKPGEALHIVNRGGRDHTFTEVAAFGGGFVPPLSIGLTFAPECAAATIIPPGGRQLIRSLAEGDHKFQCCIHPWMRALVKVEEE